jgi:hypothetical protein
MIQSKYLSSIFFSLLFAAGSATAQQAVTEDEAAPAVQSAADATTPAAAENDAATAEPMVTGSVARSAFTTGVQDHEPVDQITTLTSASDKVYFFTELVDLQGQKAMHRWEYNGEVVVEVPFNVGASRWRVWSSKNLQPEWTGSWKVSVINGAGDVIAVQSLQYEAAAEQPAMTDTEEPATGVADDMTTDESTAPDQGE